MKKMTSQKRPLLQKYDIPISHLDFDYIKKSTNSREIEKIVTILRSGEEGYFPDLTKCAEDKLKELKPSSRILRQEEAILTKGSSEWKRENGNVVNWTTEVKETDKFLASISDSVQDEILSEYPPIRQQTKIGFSNNSKMDNKPPKDIVKKESSERIKSTDYNKWDKYDPDTEILKMDFEEERVQEQVENMNRINLEKSKQYIKNCPETDVGGVGKGVSDMVKKLTNVEKEKLSISYKDRGNEYFRAKEYENAVLEYTKCIEIRPTAAGYNNRAVANLKLLKFKLCLEDVDKCLESEPTNIKALLRKAQALVGLDKRREAHIVYTSVLDIDPQHPVALTALKDLEKQLPNLTRGTRIKIIDENPESNVVSTIKEPKNPPKSPRHNIDPAQLIVPKKIVKNKILTAMQSLGGMQKAKPCSEEKKERPDAAKDIRIFTDLGPGEIVKRKTIGKSGCIIEEL